MVDKVNIDLDEKFLTKFFALTDRIIPEDQDITLLMLRKQLEEIEEQILELKMEAQTKKPEYVAPSQPMPTAPYMATDAGAPQGDTFNLPKKNILVIDDLGVITYQLSVLFKQYNYEVVTSKEIYDAIEKFKKQNFEIVILDLFIPTEREGFILLEELKKISSTKHKPSKIGVMSASSKKEHKQICKMKGAEFYIEKADDWQRELFSIVNELKV